MANALLNNQLHVSYPATFEVMNAEEAAKTFMSDVPNRWAIRDDNAHIIVAITWHESRAGLLQKLASTKDLAKRAEHKARSAIRSGGSQSVSELRQSQICGEEAWGFDYAYEVQGVRQVSEVQLFKHAVGKVSCCYTIYYYARQENAQRSHEVLDQIIASLKFE